MELIRFYLCGVLYLLSSTAWSIEEHGVRDKILACYYLSSHRVPVSKIPPDLCTHIIFAFGKATIDGINPVHSSDIRTYKALLALKQMNPSLKVLLSLQDGFPKVVDGGLPVMKTFTKNAIMFLRKYGFDGVDFDWEFPKKSQRNNYMKLLEMFRKAVKERVKLNPTEELSPLLMSMALSNSKSKATAAYNIPLLNEYIDFATVMTYDFHVYNAKYDNVTGYNSPLFSHPDESKYASVSGLVKFYIDAGLERSRILMGMPTYGRTYTLVNPTLKHGLHAPACGKGAGGPVIHQPGVFITMEICMVQRNATGGAIDPQSKVPYLYKDRTWLTYDDPKSYLVKCKWASEERLRGMGVWALPLDDISNTCHGGLFPMINTLKSCLK